MSVRAGVKILLTMVTSLYVSSPAAIAKPAVYPLFEFCLCPFPTSTTIERSTVDGKRGLNWAQKMRTRRKMLICLDSLIEDVTQDRLA
jgi:hypothetical protein